MTADSKLYDQIRSRVLSDMEAQINAGIAKEACEILDRHEGNIGHLAGLVNNLTQATQKLTQRIDAIEAPLPGEQRKPKDTKPN